MIVIIFRNRFFIKCHSILMVILIITCNSQIYGQEPGPIQTDRPDQTETPFTVPKNHFQMENGFTFEKSKNNTNTYYIPSILSKYGLNEHFEIGVITEFSSIKSDENYSGLTPVTLRFKENICSEKGLLPITSFIGYLSLPKLASEEFKASYFAPAFRFTMQHTLSEKFTFGYNLGAEWDGESAEPSFIYTVTTGYAITDKFGAYIELFGFAPQKSIADNRFDGGVSYLLRNNILIDVSGGIGLNENSRYSYISFGFSFRLKD